jgi:hypothetical protein
VTATLSTTIVGGNFPQRRSHLQGQEADPLLREGRQILRTWTKRGAPARAERSIATSHQTCYSSESAKWALRGRRNAREARRRQDRNHSERHIGQAAIPLQAGESAVYNSGGFGWVRHKDWWEARGWPQTWTHAVQAKEAYAPCGETYNEAGTPDRSAHNSSSCMPFDSHGQM